MRLPRRILLSLLVLFAGRAAHAGGCYFVTLPASIPFGSYSVFSGSQLASTQTFQAFCTPNSSGAVLISAGSAGTFSPYRTMSGPATMNYNLYQDSGYTTIWGDSGVNTYPVVNGTPLNKNFNLTIYGAVQPAQDMPAGSYSDTVTITMSPCANNQLCSATIPVTATVASECISTSFTLDFGSYDPIVQNRTTPATGNAPFTVYCTKATTAWVALDNGQNATGNVRNMAGPGGARLPYDIFKDSGYATRWASGTSSTSPNINAGTSISKNTPLGPTPGTLFQAWGRIPAGQDVPYGGYQDTITATINY